MIQYINDSNGNLIVVMQQTAAPINTTPFVETQAAAEKLLAEQAKLAEQIEVKPEELKNQLKKVIAESAKSLEAEGIVPKEIISKHTSILENGQELRITTVKGEPRKSSGITLNKNC